MVHTVVLEGQFVLGWGVSELRLDDGVSRFRVEWTADSGLVGKMRDVGFDPAWTPGYGAAPVRLAGTVVPSSPGQSGIFLVHRVERIGTATVTDSPPV
ncbi:MAG: hypothetical protein AB7N24_08055 [Dehalococcoidia bacterium]